MAKTKPKPKPLPPRFDNDALIVMSNGSTMITDVNGVLWSVDPDHNCLRRVVFEIFKPARARKK